MPIANGFWRENSSGTTLFVWDGQALLGLGGSSSGAPTGVNYLLLQEPETFGGLISVTSTATGTPIYYIYDALGSMIAEWETGGIEGKAVYKAFGEILESSGAVLLHIGSPFLWNARSGYYYDTDLGSYHAGEREMLALIGRWTKPDPLGLGPDINPFRVVGNNVVILSDPTGLRAWDCITCGACAGVAGARRAALCSTGYWDNRKEELDRLLCEMRNGVACKRLDVRRSLHFGLCIVHRACDSEAPAAADPWPSAQPRGWRRGPLSCVIA